LRQNHKDCVPAFVRAENPGRKAHNPSVHVIKHEGRFINLQRLLIMPSDHGKKTDLKAAAAAIAGETPFFTKVNEVAAQL
jgi:hypothetical protein